jgi:hypothetical protein
VAPARAAVDHKERGFHTEQALAAGRARGEVDRLAKAFVNYLNHGRHVMDQGTLEGEFPVDHQDAGFAIAVTQVILWYASRALAAALAELRRAPGSGQSQSCPPNGPVMLYEQNSTSAAPGSLG